MPWIAQQDTAWYAFFHYRFLDNQVWQWASLLGVLILSFLVGKTVSFLLAQYGKRISGNDGSVRVLGMVLQCASGPLMLMALSIGLYVARLFMDLGFGLQAEATTQPAGGGVLRGDEGGIEPAGPIEHFWVQVTTTLSVIAVGWFIYRLIDVLEHLLRQFTSKTDTLLDDQLVPMFRRAMRVFVVIVVFLFLAQNVFQWDIAALIAGLGIGGLALALAAKDLLANLFGSVTIFADRPFHMGDRIKLGGFDGMVEEVGFRTTRIRTLDGNLVTVPNSVMVNEAVENISRRPSIKRVLEIGVTYDTPPAKLQRGVEIVEEMLEARKDSFPEDYPPRVYFSDFNASSLGIIVYYWFTPPDWWEYMAFNHGFNSELLRRFNEEGIEFAFPTQTVYVKKDQPDAAQ